MGVLPLMLKMEKHEETPFVGFEVVSYDQNEGRVS